MLRGTEEQNKQVYKIKTDNLWIENADCLTFLKKIPNQAVDLILVDPPYGVNGNTFNKHYNRAPETVISGYQEAPSGVSYEDWAYSWIKEFERILKPNGAVIIFSGWSCEVDIQNAVRKTKQFRLINHLIWWYNFAVYTSTKFASSHCHILYYAKNDGRPYFNQNAYHNEEHKNQRGGSARYDDLQDVIKMNREFKYENKKNYNSLPLALVEKLIKHTTRVNDVVLDVFSGSFTTQFAALKLKRKAWGCEINPECCKVFFPKLAEFHDVYHDEVDLIGYPKSPNLQNQWKPLSVEEKEKIINFFGSLPGTKKSRIETTARYFRRGWWSIKHIIRRYEQNEKKVSSNISTRSA